MTICYFGIYNPNHSRNRLNIKGLRQNGVTVLECNTRDQSFRKYWQLIRRHFFDKDGQTQVWETVRRKTFGRVIGIAAITPKKEIISCIKQKYF